MQPIQKSHLVVVPLQDEKFEPKKQKGKRYKPRHDLPTQFVTPRVGRHMDWGNSPPLKAFLDDEVERETQVGLQGIDRDT
ncbi:hypothetical protein B296_00022577 [Ensete ventricosum]|uniref:Uncharacterized protein n=1 Tax=Ensete ventricosum TaxID=4639 RepID=A0A427ALE4_ENSVE|nr:hypothetical protein B296_00022577 [Ensete ventricosum]